MSTFEPVKLSIWTEDGESETVELGGPGGTIRVAVGEEGRQSGIWRIWSPPNKSDVYIGVRAILGNQKWSGRIGKQRLDQGVLDPSAP